MSKQIDLDKPLSDEDREYLLSRSRYYDVEENDRQFKKGKFAEDKEPKFQPANTVAAPPIEPGSDADNPPRYVGARPYGVDRAAWGGSTGLSEQEAYVATAPEPHTEVEGQVQEVAPEDLNVEELKDELRERELPLDGNKADLVKRLKKALKEEQK